MLKKLSEELLQKEKEFNLNLIENFRESDPNSKSIFFMSYINRFAMSGVNTYEYLKKYNTHDLSKLDKSMNGKEYIKLIKRLRSTIKYSEPKKIAKYKKILEEYNRKDYELAHNKSIFNLLVYNLGVYKYNNKFIGNTFLNRYYFRNLIGMDIYDNNQLSQCLMEMSSAIGSLLITGFNRSINNIDNIINIKFESDDYEVYKDRKTLFKQGYNKELMLILFNVLCDINFLIYVIGNITDNEDEFYFKLKFISYYNTIRFLKDIHNYALNKKIEIGSNNYINNILILESIIKYPDIGKLKNILQHYEIKESDISEEELILEAPFYGLIEKYTDKSYKEYNNEVTKKLYELSEILEEWILIK